MQKWEYRRDNIRYAEVHDQFMQTIAEKNKDSSSLYPREYTTIMLQVNGAESKNEISSHDPVMEFIENIAAEGWELVSHSSNKWDLDMVEKKIPSLQDGLSEKEWEMLEVCDTQFIFRQPIGEDVSQE